MRKGWREVLFLLTMFLAGDTVRAARYEKAKPGVDELIGITVELSWTAPAAEPRGTSGTKSVPAPDVTLGTTEGTVTEVISWPPRIRLRLPSDPARARTASGISDLAARGACAPGSRWPPEPSYSCVVVTIRSGSRFSRSWNGLSTLQPSLRSR